ncbi:MAG: MFS transporter [Rickettsiales bacterium]|nr:MFS transporter [Rickettsiales bacterium]
MLPSSQGPAAENNEYEMSTIQVEQLSRDYGPVRAVNSISFVVEEGEVLGFLGPNGAGKTTTMRMLTGSLGLSGGRIEIAGFDIARQSRKARQQIGYLPERPPLYPSMTVEDYLDFAARLRGVPPNRRAEAVTKSLVRTDLGTVRGRLIRHLSKGFKQRVGIAQALVHSPRVLILDEPTSGLDPAQVADIRELLGELKGEHTVVLSTHILSEVAATCDRVIIISQGHLIAAGTEADLRSTLTRSQRVELLLARPNSATGETLASLDGVIEVEERAGGSFLVTTQGGDVREALNAAASAFGLLESRPHGGLEELYLEALSQNAAGETER